MAAEIKVPVLGESVTEGTIAEWFKLIPRAVALDIIYEPDKGRLCNGVVLDEPYLYRDDTGATEPTFASDESRWLIPGGELFVMGDHRQASEDSRAFGPIPVSSVIGRGMLRYWPLAGLGIIATPTYDGIPAP